MNKQRPFWDEYFMQITTLVSSRSTCMRRQVGALLVKDRKGRLAGYAVGPGANGGAKRNAPTSSPGAGQP